MNTIDIPIQTWSSLGTEEQNRILDRSQTDIEEILEPVRAICERVRIDGDRALREFSRRFDGADLNNLNLEVQESEFDAAGGSLTQEVREALDYSIENVRRFHAPQAGRGNETVEVRPGLWASERTIPVDSVLLYVPRGRGSFPSMLYMLAVPAILAGVERVSVATPPNADGSVDSAVLYAARACGVHHVYRTGGAQAIAAGAYGTESIQPVVKIVGPGSAYVAAAKRIVSDTVDVGLPAGPSEAIVLADETADPWTVALDLMIEAEHGSDSSALLVTDSSSLARAVRAAISELWNDVPEPRKTFLKDVFTGYGGIVLFPDQKEAISFVNRFAPEHLMLHTAEPYDVLSRIRHAGEILIGPHSAFSLANYATGANAVLPTGGWAKSFSPVSVHDFQKRSSVVHVTEPAYERMKDYVITLADYEGFYTHAAALRKRNRKSSAG